MSVIAIHSPRYLQSFCRFHYSKKSNYEIRSFQNWLLIPTLMSCRYKLDSSLLHLPAARVLVLLQESLEVLRAENTTLETERDECEEGMTRLKGVLYAKFGSTLTPLSSAQDLVAHVDARRIDQSGKVEGDLRQICTSVSRNAFVVAQLRLNAALREMNNTTRLQFATKNTTRTSTSHSVDLHHPLAVR